MTWTPFTPPASATIGKAPPPPVSMSATEGKGNHKPRIYLSVRAPSAAEIGWWTAGAAVSVAIGDGEHAGMMRVTPGGLFALRSSGGKDPKKAAVLLVLPLLPGVVRGLQPSTGVQWDYAEDWLEVTLPTWCAPPEQVPSAPATRQPFRGVGSTAPDPMIRKTEQYVTRKVGSAA